MPEPLPALSGPPNAFTVDVEDYYSVFARDRLGRDFPPTDAVVRNTHSVLDLLAETRTRATFFFLGEVAESFPALVRLVAEAGHEIGVHGHRHRQVFKLTPEQFAADLDLARGRIEDAAGRAAPGHRAAAFSIRPDTAWALDVLAERGFDYDSSVFPIAARRYGWPGFPLDIHRRDLPSGRSIVEAPLPVTRLLGKALPCGGGGYLRHLPYAYNRWALRRVERCRPAIVYMHPYELDEQGPPEAFAADLASADPGVRKFHGLQLRNRRSVGHKLRRLLREFRFAPLGEVIEAALQPSSGPEEQT